jgi:hypothetical protein
MTYIPATTSAPEIARSSPVTPPAYLRYNQTGFRKIITTTLTDSASDSYAGATLFLTPVALCFSGTGTLEGEIWTMRKVGYRTAKNFTLTGNRNASDMCGIGTEGLGTLFSLFCVSKNRVMSILLTNQTHSRDGIDNNITNGAGLVRPR